MKVKRCASSEVYKLDVWIKGNLSGKKKLSFLLRKDDEKGDVECTVYKSVLEDIRKYLATKPNVNRKHLPVPEAFVCNNPPDNEEVWSDFFILEDVSCYGFIRDPFQGDFSRGLDYEHSISIISTLAKFHATSFCYRKDNFADMKKLFPVLGEPQLPLISTEIALEIEKILETLSGFEKYSDMFVAALKGEIGNGNQKSRNMFDVVCHGNVTRENVLFKYKNQMDMKQSCQDSVLIQLDKCFYG